MPTSWKSMSVANLRDIARSYKNLHSLGNISKQPKATLIETLSKVMEWKAEKLYTKKEHGGKEVATYQAYEGEIHNTHAKKPQPKKAEQPQPKKAEKDHNAMMEKDAKKKSVKKAISQAKSASKDAKAIAPPSQKGVEKMTLEKRIQSLPPELQNEIFKKLPENLQGKALGKTDEDMGAEFIKKRLPKAQLKTRADVKDFIYELMGVDEEFERDHYEDLTERTNNDFNYEYGNAEGMSDRRFQKLFERTDEKIFREKMNEYRTILIDGRKEKASPSVIRNKLLAFI